MLHIYWALYGHASTTIPVLKATVDTTPMLGSVLSGWSCFHDHVMLSTASIGFSGAAYISKDRNEIQVCTEHTYKDQIKGIKDTVKFSVCI